MTRIRCTQAKHAAFKASPDRMRAECVFLGISDLEYTILELYNCVCHSTISTPGIGPETRYEELQEAP